MIYYLIYEDWNSGSIFRSYKVKGDDENYIGGSSEVKKTEIGIAIFIEIILRDAEGLG